MNFYLSLGLSFSEHLGVKNLQKANLEEKLDHFHNFLHSLSKFCITPELPKNCDPLKMLQRNISAYFVWYCFY